MSKFKIGDVVALASGGPLMTIAGSPNETGGPEAVRCLWFAGLERREGDFPEEALVKASGISSPATTTGAEKSPP